MTNVVKAWYIDPETNKKFEAIRIRTMTGEIGWLAPLWVRTPPVVWKKVALT